MHTTDNNGNKVSLNLEHVVFTMPNGTVCCDRVMYSLTAADVKRINEYVARKTARIETEAAAEKSAELSRAGRRQRLRIEAGMPMVEMARTFELREDVFDAARNASTAQFDTYAAAMMGGEPYSVWH